MRAQGGYLGFRRTPTSTAASGVWTLREAETFKRAGTWPLGADNDQYWSSVKLLLHTDGNDDGQTFTDSSANARTVTRGGNAVTKTATKKYGTASAYFAASGDYLSLADSDGLELGSSEFAIEMWIQTTSSTQYATLASRVPAAFSTGMWSLMVNYASSTAGDIAFFAGDINAGVSPVVSGGSGLRDGEWHHVALSRSGSTWSLYVDGTRVSTATSSATIANIAGGVNIARDEFYGRQYVGYIDDLRITISSARDYVGATITTPASAHPDG